MTISSKKNQTLFGNASALLVIQIANQLIPLLTVPYLTRVLGVGNYGLIAFCMAIIILGSVVTDYGFNLSVTLKIAKYREKHKRVNKLIGAVLTVKTVLLIFVAIGIVVFAIFTKTYAENKLLLIVLIFPLTGQTYQPVWFFQGIERMSYIAIFIFISRLLYLLLVFTTVTSSEHMVWLMTINGLAQFAAAGIGYIVMRRLGYWPQRASLTYCLKVWRQSTEFFWSRAAASTYTACGAIFLGLTATTLQVGYYAAAEQIYRGAQSLLSPVAQAIYPNMVRTKNFRLLFRILLWMTMICIIGVFLGSIFGPWVINFLYGEEFFSTQPVLMVFLITLAINTPSVLIGYPLLGALGHSHAANLSVMFAGALQIILLSFLFIIGWTQALYVAMTVLIVEFVVLVLRAIWGRKCYRAWIACKVTGSGV